MHTIPKNRRKRGATDHVRKNGAIGGERRLIWSGVVMLLIGFGSVVAFAGMGGTDP